MALVILPVSCLSLHQARVLMCSSTPPLSHVTCFLTPAVRSEVDEPEHVASEALSLEAERKSSLMLTAKLTHLA